MTDNIENGEEYYQSSYDGLDFAQHRFTQIEWEDCVFTGCDFSQAQFVGCRILDCRFINCNFSLARFDRSRLYQVSFTDSKLLGIDWTKALWSTNGVAPELNFVRCNLSDSSFFGLFLQHSRITECRIHGCDFRNADLRHSHIKSSDLAETSLAHANLDSVDFTGSQNIVLEPGLNNLQGTKLPSFEALALVQRHGVILVD